MKTFVYVYSTALLILGISKKDFAGFSTLCKLSRVVFGSIVIQCFTNFLVNPYYEPLLWFMIYIIKYLIVGIVKENYGFPKNAPQKNLKTILSPKTVHKCIGTTLQRLKIDSKSLKTHLEWSYRISKISKTTTFSSDGLPD